MRPETETGRSLAQRLRPANRDEGDEPPQGRRVRGMDQAWLAAALPSAAWAAARRAMGTRKGEQET